MSSQCEHTPLGEREYPVEALYKLIEYLNERNYDKELHIEIDLNRKRKKEKKKLKK